MRGLPAETIEAPAPHRLAIYFAPGARSALARFGATWLGRDAERGVDLAPPTVPGMPADRLRALTAAPRRYGFHATLKAPFRLAEGYRPGAVLGEVEDFARRRKAITLTGLDLVEIGPKETGPKEAGPFLALVPKLPLPALADLANDCVRHFDDYRAPPESGEIARRRAAGLTPHQDDLLHRWGYPFVFSEFRFHLTLTGPVPDPLARAALLAYLRALDPCPWAGPIAIDSLCAFLEPAPGRPFRLIARFPLAGRPGDPPGAP